MVKRLYLVFTLTLLLSAVFLPLQAQDEAACKFEANPSATVFDNLAKVSDLGIKPEDINELAKAARDPNVQAEGFLVSKGYDEAMISEIFADPTNAYLVNQLVHPSPTRDILDRAYALLASYGLPSGALVEIYKLTSDQQALYDNLIGRGLSPEQADGLVSAALGLAEEARSLGVFGYAATLDGQDVFDKYGYHQIPLNAISNNLGDPQALREQLIQEGVSESDADQMVVEFQTLTEEQGLTENYMNSWQTKGLTYSLDYYGIPEDEVLSLAAMGDSEAIEACLADAGFDQMAIDIAVSELDNYLIGEEGEEAWLTPKDIVEVAFDEIGVLGVAWGLTGEELAGLNQYADDPDALREALIQDYGFSPDDADLFATDFDNSVFSDVFDDLDEDSIGMIDESISAAENGEDFALDEDFDIDGFVAEIIEDDASDDDDVSDDDDASDDGTSDDESSGDDGG